MIDGVSDLRLVEPELDEARKLLDARRQGGVDGDAARRRAVLVLLAGGAEVAGTLEGEPVRLLAAAVHDTESGEAEVGGQFAGQLGILVIEAVGRIDELARLTVRQLVDAHAERIVLVDVEEAHGTRAGAGRP